LCFRASRPDICSGPRRFSAAPIDVHASPIASVPAPRGIRARSIGFCGAPHDMCAQLMRVRPVPHGCRSRPITLRAGPQRRAFGPTRFRGDRSHVRAQPHDFHDDRFAFHTKPARLPI
jgi:hypothetical protein